MPLVDEKLIESERLTSGWMHTTYSYIHQLTRGNSFLYLSAHFTPLKPCWDITRHNKVLLSREVMCCPAVDPSEVIAFNPAASSISPVPRNLICWCVFHLNLTAVFLTSDSDPNQEEYPDAAVWTHCVETKEYNCVMREPSPGNILK